MQTVDAGQAESTFTLVAQETLTTTRLAVELLLLNLRVWYRSGIM